MFTCKSSIHSLDVDQLTALLTTLYFQSEMKPKNINFRMTRSDNITKKMFEMETKATSIT